MRSRVWIIAVILFLFSCNNASDKKYNSSEQLIGEWNNLSMRVETNSKNNSDSNEVFDVPQGQWKQMLKIKPIRTFFRADSTYKSDYYNLKDSLVRTTSGRWWVEGDKLVWLEKMPSVDSSVYTVKVANDTASFETMLDWDGDGKKDDKYFGKQIKVSSAKK